MTAINSTGVLSRALLNEPLAVEKKPEALKNLALHDAITHAQILKTVDVRVPTAAEFETAINAFQPSEADWQDVTAAITVLSDDVRSDLIFDPGAWEKHANVLVAAIIALNIARVANAQLRGHFSVMASDAAKAQGAAIVETGKAALNSAFAQFGASAVTAGFAMFTNLKGQAMKHADISLHKRNTLDASTIGSDLKRDRQRDDWDPQTTSNIQTFDDFGRITTVDFQPKGTTLTPKEQAWFDDEILKAQKIGQTSEWLSQMGSKGIEKKLELGRQLSAISVSFSQLVSSLVRLSEHKARENEVLQQSAQNTQKSLSDEVGQKDSSDAALLQKLMDMVMQILQSRIEVMGRV